MMTANSHRYALKIPSRLSAKSVSRAFSTPFSAPFSTLFPGPFPLFRGAVLTADFDDGNAGQSLDQSAVKKFRFSALILALLCYGFFGSPTPDNPGWAELFVGLLLILAAGPLTTLYKIRSIQSAPLWMKALGGFILYGLTVPVLHGLIAGNDQILMIRDILPFLFLCLPFFTLDLFDGRPDRIRLLLGTVIILGLIFSARVFMPFISVLVSSNMAPFIALPDWQQTIIDPFYFANAPTVLFAAIILTGLAVHALFKSAALGSIGKSCLYALVLCLPLIAMISITQRATIGWYALSVIIFMGLCFYRQPARAGLPLVILSVICVVMGPFILDVLDTLVLKTQAVGVNMRIAEASAVFQNVTGHPLDFFFGLGWGATFESPAVAGYAVNFTHNLLTATLLKTGFVGLSFLVLFLISLCPLLYKLSFRYPLYALALTGPFLINILLYASYKSLDFGLIVLLICVLGSVRLRQNTL